MSTAGDHTSGETRDGYADLAADIRGLIHERGAESALLVGHDWADPSPGLPR